MAKLNRELQHGREVWRISFYDRDGNRRKIRLGEIGKKAAETICFRVGQLADAAEAGLPLDGELTTWLAKIGQDLATKLAEAGIAPVRESGKLGAFIDAYIASRTDAKANTIRNFKSTRSKLTSRLGEDRELRTISPGDADDWRQTLVSAGYSEAVVSKAVKHARQFFKVAERRGLVARNPFNDVKTGSERNEARLRYIDRATIDRVLDMAPDAEWRAIIALARFGGLRTPSETLALKWTDIDWANDRITVPSPKTERNGKAYRIVPLFPELRTYLDEAHQIAADGSVYVVHRFRDAGSNLRTTMLRIIKRAGLESWPRVFHNLRASRQTELADQFPAHVVATWLGNSPAIAERHYLKTNQQHFERAVQGSTEGGAEGGPKVGQQVGLQANAPDIYGNEKTSDFSEVCEAEAAFCGVGKADLILPTGVVAAAETRENITDSTLGGTRGGPDSDRSGQGHDQLRDCNIRELEMLWTKLGATSREEVLRLARSLLAGETASGGPRT